MAVLHTLGRQIGVLLGGELLNSAIMLPDRYNSVLLSPGLLSDGQQSLLGVERPVAVVRFDYTRDDCHVGTRLIRILMQF